MANKPDSIRKVLVLRTYLAALQEYTRPTFDVDYPGRGGVHGAGSRLSTLRGWLMPDVMLCLDRSDLIPVFVLIVDTRETFAATLKGIDVWLKAHELITVQQEIDEALLVLQRAASRLNNSADTSTAHKSLNALRKTLINHEAAA